jgi:exodeoxyribonuclease VII small subunit
VSGEDPVQRRAGNGAAAGEGRAPRDTPSYEAARAELTEVVRALESGGQSLEESLRLWQRGEELAQICQRWLDGATARLDEAIATRDAATDTDRDAAAGGNRDVAADGIANPDPGR